MKNKMTKEPISFSFLSNDLACYGHTREMETWRSYVRVCKNHPLYEIDYSEVEVEIHGGLTFSDRLLIFTPECLIANDINVWWFGFDCNLDLPCTFQKAECSRLAKQLANWPRKEDNIKKYIIVPTGKRLIDIG